METVSTLANTVGVADLDEFCEELDGDITVETASFVNRGVVEQALDIADAIGLRKLEIAVLDGSEDNADDTVTDPLVALREPDADAALIVAPRSRDLTNDDGDQDGDA